MEVEDRHGDGRRAGQVKEGHPPDSSRARPYRTRGRLLLVARSAQMNAFRPCSCALPQSPVFGCAAPVPAAECREGDGQ